MESGPTTPTRDHRGDQRERDAGVDERSALVAARAAMLAERRACCRLLEAAAVWADLHPSDSLLSPDQRLEEYGEKAVLFGGPGWPPSPSWPAC
ncbi:hypothetical protein [Microlunatus sp. Gsoil 973]|uniref:hypothetical protein n=1 Tax=Microlunatus sp. Gsoil 973 TaxID=2672569 RepID=UPI0012B4DA04|nr:hypothetical protein [Microlunatus sp. Gsoil 973]QGN32351.1 hypothetical protein GJV80_05595 [Microlunatus sp. Gsoil 973]